MYFLKHVTDITNLVLQKLLYYAQGFSKPLLGYTLFEDECQAWKYGPVYPEIYEKYKYSWSVQSEPDDFLASIPEASLSALSSVEREYLESLTRAFRWYSSPILIDFPHSESPWKNARGSLEPSDPSTNVISNADIETFFSVVVDRYSIKTPDDIQKYCNYRFKSVRSRK